MLAFLLVVVACHLAMGARTQGAFVVIPTTTTAHDKAGGGRLLCRASSSVRSIVLSKYHHHHYRHRRWCQTTLWSTIARNGNRRSSSGNAQQSSRGNEYDVLYQKVLRAPTTATAGVTSSSSSRTTSTTFLLDLVTYLQSIFELPSDLPMPYELTVPSDDNDGNDDGAENDILSASDNGEVNRAVLIIDSSLSRDPYATRLEVEVIGIFPDNASNEGGNAIVGPTMAMVVLKKRKRGDKSSSSTIGGGSDVASGLFAGCEQRIVKSLDRGLQDLEEGRITIPTTTFTPAYDLPFDDDNDDDGVDAAVKRIAYQNAIKAASMSNGKIQRESTQQQANKSNVTIKRDGSGIIDSTPLSSVSTTLRKNTKQLEKKKDERKISETSQRNDEHVSLSTTPSLRGEYSDRIKKHGDEDYAVQMARQRAEALMTTVRAGITTSSAKGTVAISGGESDFAIMAAKRAALTASNRESMEKETPVTTSTRGKKVEEDEGSQKSATNASPVVQKGQEVQDLSRDATFLQLRTIANAAKKSSWKSTIPKMNGPNVNASSLRSGSTRSNPTEVVSFPKSSVTTFDKTDDEIRDDVLQVARGNNQIQQELKAASDMMKQVKLNDEDEEEEDLSPEELLTRILKFGNEKDREERPGNGFVEGAFDKAKELLYKDDTSFREIKRKNEEDELRQIFADGESVAESRLSQAISSSSSSNLVMPTMITDEFITDLINADDNSVPRNARILDDEYAELEIRISRSLDEGSDGPTKNKMFDLFSGPEVYNPNVAETSVNWPGAKEGTRTDVKLATDLSTALKQARFASAVLSHMREEIDDVNSDEIRYFVGSKELSQERVNLLRKCVNEAVNVGLIDDPDLLLMERSRLQMLIDELLSQPEERLEEIAMNYKDLLLSDHLVDHMKERLYAMAQRDLDARRRGEEDSLKEAHESERAILVNLSRIAQSLVKEAQALGAELEVSMLEIIRSICEVAMDPRHTSEDETAVALTDAVRDMRPLLDDAFVAYLKYAIAEEEGKLARAGVLDDPEHNRWLFVLKIVQEGVYRELSRGVKRYIDHIWYVLRMKTKVERKELLKQLIDVMPTMDVRPFVKVVNNIVSSLSTSARGDFTDSVILGEMTNQLLQLRSDVDEFLPPERINEMSKDADAWAATQRQKLLERRNLTKQRLEAARQTGDIDPDAVIKRPGWEAERFD
jgi:hypothetical protein